MRWSEIKWNEIGDVEAIGVIVPEAGSIWL